MGERVKAVVWFLTKGIVIFLLAFGIYTFGLFEGMAHAKKITREHTVLEINLALKEVGSLIRIDATDRYIKIIYLQKRKAVKKLEDRTESPKPDVAEPETGV